MFEKAREFREKYYTPFEPVEDGQDIILAGKLLERHAQNYCRRASKLRSEILVLEGEILLMQNEIDDFLVLYYEKFSEILIDSGIFSNSLNVVGSAFHEDDEAVSLFEKRAQAYSSELKKVYRKLVKDFHPDANGDEKELEYFYKIQNSYEKGDLTELLYIQTQLENRVEKNVIEMIEKLEAEIKVYDKKLIKLVETKIHILSSPEYKLFIKFKLSEIRGYNFFEELFKRVSLN